MSNVRNVVGNVFTSAYACAANLPLKAKVLANDSYSKVSTIATKLFSSIQANATDVRERIVKSSLFASLATLAKKVSDFFNSIFKNKKEELDESVEDQFVMIPSPRKSRKIQEQTVETTEQAPVETTEQAPVETTEQAPVETTEQAPVETTEQAPVETTEQAPVETTEQAPVETTEQAPVETTEQAPVETTEQAPVETTEQASVETEAEDEQVDETGESSESDTEYEYEEEEKIESQPGYVSSFFNVVANTLRFWKR